MISLLYRLKYFVPSKLKCLLDGLWRWTLDMLYMNKASDTVDRGNGITWYRNTHISWLTRQILDIHNLCTSSQWNGIFYFYQSPSKLISLHVLAMKRQHKMIMNIQMEHTVLNKPNVLWCYEWPTMLFLHKIFVYFTFPWVYRYETLQQLNYS